MNTPRTALEELDALADEISKRGRANWTYGNRQVIASKLRTHGKALSDALGAEQVIALLLAGGFLAPDKLDEARRIIASANGSGE